MAIENWADWTFVQNNLGDATFDLTDDIVTLTNPAGTTYDSISSLASTDDTCGVTHPVSGDFDIAFRVGPTVFKGQDSNIAGVILRGATDDEMIRWSIYGNTTTMLQYGYHRSGGSGNNWVDQSLTSLDAQMQWFRVSRVGSVYTFYDSYNGITWNELTNVTSGVDAETIKLKLGQYNANLGESQKYTDAIDLDAAGSTDARLTAPEMPQATVLTTDFSGGIPSWLTTESAVDGSATLSGSRVLLSTAAADGSYGRLFLNQTGYDHAGFLVKTTVDLDSTAATYAIIALAVQDGGVDIDQYSKLPSYGVEPAMKGTRDQQSIRAHRPITIDTLNEPYTFLGPDESLIGNDIIWYRIEKFTNKFRLRWWVDGNPEPSTWYLDSDDNLAGDNPLACYMGVSHNDGNGADATLAIEEVTFYELSTPKATAFFDVTDLPADFGNAETATITVRTRGVDIGATPLKLFAQLYQSDETTTLSDEVEVASHSSDSSFANSAAVTFTGLNTTADKSVWDNARVRFRWGT